MSTLYKRRVVMRVAKLIRKHGVENHTEASSHEAFAKEFRKREDCWEDLFMAAIKFLRSQEDEFELSETEEIELTASIRPKRSKSMSKQSKHLRRYLYHSSALCTFRLSAQIYPSRACRCTNIS